MPIIECLIERDGPTVVNDGGFKFTFEENEDGDCVCNVLSEGTARRLLNFEWFRLYEPKKKQAAEVVDPKERVLQLREEGYSYRAIAESVGRSTAFVSRILKEQT